MNVGYNVVSVRHDVVSVGYDIVSVGYDIVSVGYDIVSVRYNDLSARNDVVGVRSRGVGIDCKFSLETGGQGCERGSDRTYVEDLKDPVEFSPPGRDLFFIDPRVEKVRNRVPLALFPVILLNLRHGSAIGSILSAIQPVHNWLNPRRQLVYRLAHGLIEVFHSSPLRSPVEDFTDLGAVEPELDVVLLIGQGFLNKGGP